MWPRLEGLLTDSPKWTGGKQRLTAARLFRMLVDEGHDRGVRSTAADQQGACVVARVAAPAPSGQRGVRSWRRRQWLRVHDVRLLLYNIMATMVSRRFPSRFTIVTPLGEGGMGIVYEAFDRVRNTPIALKTLSRLDPDHLLLFKNEFRALQDIRHRNLVRLGELLEEAGNWFFTMELVRGVHYLSWVRPSDEKLSADEASTKQVANPAAPPIRGYERTSDVIAEGFDEGRLRTAIRQVAEGVYALHAGRKIHRDLKPSNILVEAGGRSVILDFGLVTDANAQIDDRLMGSISFMAPEQAARTRIGAPADWYAVGVLLYASLTGRLPFAGAPEAVLFAKQNLDAPQIADGTGPRDLIDLTMALLERDPCLRPTGGQVLERLDARTPAISIAGSEFVGRERELATLDALFDSVRNGNAATVLLTGDSGQGKSALVREFANQLRKSANPPLILTGRCYEREAVPYKALDEIVDQLTKYLASLPEEDQTAVLPKDAGLLAALFPVLAQVHGIARDGNAVDDVEARALRLRGFEAFRSLLTKLSARSPVVFAIDDLQWSDADSFTLLADLFRPPAARALLLGVVRTSESVKADDVAQSLPRPVHRMHLPPLCEDDARELLHRLTKHSKRVSINSDEIDPEATRHPLFIETLVQYRLEAGSDAAVFALDDALWWRVQAQEAHARDLLELLAVSGRPLSPEIACVAIHVDADNFDRIQTELRVLKLIRSTGFGRPGTIEPYHDRIREVLLARLSCERKRTLHGLLAQTLEQATGVDPEVIGIHWREYGDSYRATDYLLRAAEQADRALAFDRAARLYNDATAIVADRQQKNALRIKRARALASAGRAADAGAEYLKAAAEKEQAEAVELKRAAAEQLLRGGMIDLGLPVVADVLRSAGLRMPAAGRKALVSFLWNRLRLRIRGLQPTAGQLAARNLQLLEIYRTVALGLSMFDNLRAFDFMTRALLLELRAGRPAQLAWAFAMEAAFASTRGHRARARGDFLAARAVNLADSTGDVATRAWVRSAAIGTASFFYGDFRRGLTECDQALAVFAKSRVPGVAWETGTQRLFSVWHSWFLGDVNETRRRLDEYIRDAKAFGDSFALTNFRLGHCTNAWLAADQPAEARAHALSAIGEWSRQAYHLQHFLALYSRVQIALYEGDGVGAYREMTHDARRLQKTLLLRIVSTRLHFHDLYARASLAAAQSAQSPLRTSAGLLKEAARHGEALVAMNERHSVPMGLLIRARVEQLRKRPANARAQLILAREDFTMAEMKLYCLLVDRRIAEIDDNTSGVVAVDDRLRDLGIESPEKIARTLTP